MAEARAWYRRDLPLDDWHDSVFDDFERICTILGVDLATRPVRLFGGGSRQKPSIWFSGFWSQGDGACFEGTYRYAKGSATALRAYAPEDAELHRIGEVLAAIQRPNFNQLEASMRHQGRCYHEYAMAISVERSAESGQDPSPGAEEAVIEALRDLARWLYRQLEREYDYQTSDEVVDEAILANEYSFTEVGERFP
jgi:hypothetical protein